MCDPSTGWTVEFYGGGLAVLLNKNPSDPRHQWGEKSFEQGISEVVNDVYRPLQNFWDVLKDENAFLQFQRTLEATPFSEVEFNRAEDVICPTVDLDVDAALAFFIRCRQSRTGAFRDFAPLSRNRTRRKMNEQASAWWNATARLEPTRFRDRQQSIWSKVEVNDG